MNDQYQVIARRWRPKSFKELVGQEHIVQTLQNAIEKNRIAHAYLFVGPRGTGKTSTARLFACALNAEGGPSINADPDSDISRSIMTGQSMDVIEIDGASNNSVDQIRDLCQDCAYAPAQNRFKIYIIDEVHMLSNAAFNALLKTLEEPPEHVKFFFATTESHKVLPTIVSRCQRFEFRPIEDSVIVSKLRHIAEVEEIKISDNALESIAKLSGGGMRDAQSIMDQMIAFCGDDIKESDVTDVYGLAPHDQLENLVKIIESREEKSLLEAIDTLVGEGRDLYRILLDLEKHFRQRMLEVMSGRKAQGFDVQAYVRVIDTLKSGEDAVKRGLSDRVNFEITLLKAIRELKSVSIDAVIRRIAGIADGLPETPKKKLSEEPSPAQESPEPPKPKPVAIVEEPEEEPFDPEPEYESVVLGEPPVAEPLATSIDPTEQPEPRDLTPFVEQLSPSTRKILDEDFHASFIHLIPPK